MWISTAKILKSNVGLLDQKIILEDMLEHCKKEKHAIEYNSFLLSIYKST
jgi:hypothetical protein